MPTLTVKMIEDGLRKEVLRLDKRVQLVGVTQSKKKDSYRVSLQKDGKTSAADLKKDLLEECLSQEGKGSKLRSALGKAVSRLNVAYRK